MRQSSGENDYIFLRVSESPCLRVKRSPALSTLDPINSVNVPVPVPGLFSFTGSFTCTCTGFSNSKFLTSNLKHVIIFPMKPEAERIRIRYLYRRKILNGELNVSHSTAKRMVGPDCAYHLYGKHSSSGEEKGKRLKGKGKEKSRNS